MGLRIFLRYIYSCLEATNWRVKLAAGTHKNKMYIIDGFSKLKLNYTDAAGIFLIRSIQTYPQVLFRREITGNANSISLANPQTHTSASSTSPNPPTSLLGASPPLSAFQTTSRASNGATCSFTRTNSIFSSANMNISTSVRLWPPRYQLRLTSRPNK